MLSLDNTYSEEEVRIFTNGSRAVAERKNPVVIEPKVDGVAVSVMYENGRLKYAATRGDGVVGDDITQNVKTIRSVPHQLRGDAPDIFEVPRRSLSRQGGFEKLNDERKSRGSAALCESPQCRCRFSKASRSESVARRPLGIVFYGTGAVEGGRTRSSLEESFRLFKNSVCRLTKIGGSADIR
jgi:DNA ligase (NAD+)